jgi:hypothetical protein
MQTVVATLKASRSWASLMPNPYLRMPVPADWISRPAMLTAKNSVYSRRSAERGRSE